jgi:Domain of unknown function (DUF4406)
MSGAAYISGPISGVVGWREKFEEARKALLAAGYDSVYVPADFEAWPHAGECPRVAKEGHAGNHSYACHLRGDLIGMLSAAKDIWMMKGWEASEGARLELMVAAACGLPVFFFSDSSQ